MILIATALILLGAVSATLGLKLFRVILPFVGFAAGVMVGFGGVQGVFGTGVISLTIAVLVAIIVGAIMAVLSFMFFEIAVLILAAMVGGALMSYLGIALGLGDNGVLLFLMSASGAIFGFAIAASRPMSRSLVIIATSFIGVSFIFAGILLLVGETSLDELDQNGIIPSVLSSIEDTFLGFIAWFGASIVAVSMQTKTAQIEAFDDHFTYQEK